MSDKERNEKEKILRSQFYDGIMSDLIVKGAFNLALVIYDEK